MERGIGIGIIMVPLSSLFSAVGGGPSSFPTGDEMLGKGLAKPGIVAKEATKTQT